VELPRLLDRARAMARACDPSVAAARNPAAVLGAILGEMASSSGNGESLPRARDKLTILASAEIAAFGDWLEQLIAESTGKSGTGILPVVREPLGVPEDYGEDRLFVYLELKGSEVPVADGVTSVDDALQALQDAGHPLVHIRLHDLYDLGGQFFLWELATAIAGQRLGIHPFNQPNVESAKARAKEMIERYREEGVLPEDRPVLSVPGITVYGDLQARDLRAALRAILAQVTRGAPSPHAAQGYVALQAFVRPDDETTAALQDLRLLLRDKSGLATTFGYGPRFLHSTGQLHKGDSGGGIFIQLTSDPPVDAVVPDKLGSPDSSLTFGVLIQAQALGDRQALAEAGRYVVRFHLDEPVALAVRHLADALG
ncbi:MAG TPA: transaldolase, partial [Anaerolineae bacterium]|nr:transaldolase [Anaerolineae bacterium]